MDFSCRDALNRGAEIRHVAVLETCTVKDVLRFLSRESYLVLEVYDENEQHLFNLSQNALAELFITSASPYETLKSLQKRQKTLNYK